MEKLDITGEKIITNYPRLIVLILFLVACALRFYAGMNIPLIQDEELKINIAREISFNPEKLNILIGNVLIGNPILSVHVVKLGFIIFGENNFGGRFFFILLGVLSMYFIYKLTKELLGIKTGLLTLTFLTFSQFQIGIIRLIEADGLSLFFFSLIIYVFFKAIKTGKNPWFYLIGILLGLGFHAKVLIGLLPLIFFIFISKKENYRILLKRKETYFAISLMFLLISPYIWWGFKNGINICSERSLQRIGVSLRVLYLYFAEVFAALSDKLKTLGYNFHYQLRGNEAIFLKSPHRDWGKFSTISPEVPVVHWVLSLLIFCGFFYCLRKAHRKKELINFCLCTFIFIFTITSLIGGRVSLFDKHNWAALTFYPGVIFASYMLVKLGGRFRTVNLATGILIIYFAFHCWQFIRIPESIFAVPKKEMCAYILERTDLSSTGGEITNLNFRSKWLIRNCPELKLTDRIRINHSQDQPPQ